MNLAGKFVVGGLAVVGAALVTTVIASRFVTVGLYSPYMPQYDIIAINGSTIWKLLASGGGETPPQSSSGIPFPVGLRVSWFKKPPSISETAYEIAAGRPFDIVRMLGG